ncbi:MAG: tetratricopeptide repeat protein [Bernardetiaceae bacterium]|nr:tetratricopeptide repeat protein [Bernardetiaceae bacterium]MDW8302632.1 tetratricopeptide repeat protein [Bacteroidia bacterium]
MQDIQTIKKQAEEFRRARKYAEALPLYKQLWEEHRENCNEWEGWAYAFCLKQQKEYKKSLDICREVYKLKPDFENIKSVYAWCIYYTEIAVEKVNDESKFLKAGEAILKLSKQDDPYSPYTQTVFKILEYLNNKAIYPTDKVLEWTEKLNFEILDDKPFSFTDNEGKIRELASKKEQYFMWRTKALLEKGLYDECIELSQKALDTLENFHYNNEIWFARRISLSYKGLGQPEKALEQLKSLLKRKNEWFIYKEIAEIYFEQGNHEQALKFAIDSALSPGDVDKKLNVYKLLSEILISNNQNEEAKKHIELIYQIRKANKWKIDNDLQNLINKFQIDTTKKVNSRDFERELKQLWEKLKYSNQTELTGTIKCILPNGKAGFIETENKKSYYFQLRNFKAKPELAKQGQKVTFFLEEGFDKKKNQKTENAVNVKPKR